MSIKVDREERPDVDRVYMTFVQAHDRLRRLADERLADAGAEAVLRRHLLSADVAVGPARVRRHPAARSRASGATSATRCVQSAEHGHRAAARRRDQPRAASDAARRRRARSAPSRSSGRRSTRGTAASAARRSFRGRASCCSCCASMRGPAMPSARDMVLATLRAMALGGMRDHIGGGFHRYSVDAGLARAALREDALRPGAARARLSRRRPRRPATPFYSSVAEDTLRYVMREMTASGRRVLFGRGRRQRAARSRPASRHAHKSEGAFYLWTRRGDRRAARRRTPPIVKRRFGIEAERQRADRSAAGVRRQEPPVRRRVASTELADEFGTADDGGRRRSWRARG